MRIVLAQVPYDLCEKMRFFRQVLHQIIHSNPIFFCRRGALLFKKAFQYNEWPSLIKDCLFICVLYFFDILQTSAA